MCFGSLTVDLTLHLHKWLRRGVLAVAVLFSAFWLIFEWNSFDWPPWEHGPCYSPNHQYSVTRHQTLWESLARRYPDAYGTARLYDQSGKLLYAGKTQFGGEESGPLWFDDRVAMRADNAGNPWTSPLPAPPGDDRKGERCYPGPRGTPAGR